MAHLAVAGVPGRPGVTRTLRPPRPATGSAGAHVTGRLEPGEVEHRVCEDDAEAAAQDLGQRIGPGVSPREFMAHRLNKRHGRIEVRAADGPISAISVASTATVAPVFARSAIAALPPDKRSAMTPEPTTAAARSTEPSASAVRRLAVFIPDQRPVSCRSRPASPAA